MTSAIESVQPSQLTCEIKDIIQEIGEDENLQHFEIKYKEYSFTGDNFVGNIIRVKIEPSKIYGQKPINLIIKTAPTGTASRKSVPIAEFYKNETFAYTDILPALDRVQKDNKIPEKERFAFTKMYKAITKTLEEVIILRDLADDGFVLYDKWCPMDFNHATLAVQNIARIHAASFVMKEKDPELFTSFSKNIPNKLNYGEEMVEISVRNIYQLLPLIKLENRSKIEHFAKNIPETFSYSLDASSTDPYNVICHGDCWNNNMLFKYEDGKVSEIIMIDWQLMRFASSVTDLTYMLCLSMDEDQLSLHLEDLLDIYYNTLQRSIRQMGCDPNICYPEQVFKEHIGTKMVFGLLMALTIMPFTLSEADEAQNMEDLLEDFHNGVENLKVGKIAKSRINGIVNYFTKQELI